MPTNTTYIVVFLIKLTAGLGLTLCGIWGASLGDPRAPVNIIYGVALLGLAFLVLLASIFDPSTRKRKEERRVPCGVVDYEDWARQERRQEWLKKQERSGQQAMVWRDGDIFSGKTHRFDTNQAAYNWLAAQPDPDNYHIRWGDCSPTDTKYEPDLRSK
jgi:hypothetical protein